MPSQQIKAFGDRLLGIHLRDLALKKKGIGVECRDAAVGDGNIDFKDVITAAEGEGCDYYVIEQKTQKPYQMIEKSLKELNAIKNVIGVKE